MTSPVFVLASSSPRRRALLAAAGFAFVIDPPGIDESIEADECAEAATLRLACEKAHAVAERRAERDVVLGADTSVICGGRMFGKPASVEESVDMLMQLSGRNHRVCTAWALIPANATCPGVSGITMSIVRMREIGRREATAYAKSPDPYDKAGGYAAQGDGRRLIVAVLGSIDNVIGLPLSQVTSVLAAFGVRPGGA